MRAHKRIISACTIDFRPTLTYQSTSANLRQQRLTSFCAVWCIILLEKGKHCGVFRDEGCLQSFVTKLGIVVHHHEPECPAKKMGFYRQGHSVGLYNQNMTVSTISFISSKPVSLLQPNSI